MRRIAFLALCVVASGCTEQPVWHPFVRAAHAEVAQKPITTGSKQGMGQVYLGGREAMSGTPVTIETSNTIAYPKVFHWNVGLVVKCGTAGYVCPLQASPADITINATRFTVTDSNGPDGFAACIGVGPEGDGFQVTAGAFGTTNAVGRRDGVCVPAAATTGQQTQNGRPCRVDADCRTGDLDDTDVCNTTVGNHRYTWGAFIYGNQDCSWRLEE